MVDMTKDYDQRHRAWYKIRNQLFYVQVESMFVTNETELRECGAFTTGDRHIDAAMAHSKERHFLTLEKIINIWLQKGTIDFLHPQKDLPVIHDILQEHIRDFIESEKLYRNGVYSEDEDVMIERRKGILEIDEFAKSIFESTFEVEVENGLRNTRKTFEDVLRGKSLFTTKNTEREETSGRRPAYETVSKYVDYNALRTRRKY